MKNKILQYLLEVKKRFRKNNYKTTGGYVFGVNVSFSDLVILTINFYKTQFQLIYQTDENIERREQWLKEKQLEEETYQSLDKLPFPVYSFYDDKKPLKKGDKGLISKPETFEGYAIDLFVEVEIDGFCKKGEEYFVIFKTENNERFEKTIKQIEKRFIKL